VAERAEFEGEEVGLVVVVQVAGEGEALGGGGGW
jgi:hypothetical protein